MKSAYFSSFDGTKIKYQEEGTGPYIVLANGLGGSFIVWKHIIDAFKDRFTFISWDYRGLFDSEVPSDLSSLTVENQVRDLFELLKLKNIQRAIFIGWSYGGQVLLETYKQKPHLFQGFVLLNATVAGFVSGLSLSEILNPLLKRILGIWSPAWKLLSIPSKTLISSGIFINVVKKIGLVGEYLDDEIFKTIAIRFIELNHTTFETTIQNSQDYNGEKILSTINLPVLIIAGTRDFIVLPSINRKIAKLLPNSELVFVKGTSHYTAIEKPKEVISSLETYLTKLKSES